MKKHTILFVATGTDGLALDREARAIQVELERGRYRDCFEFETRWAMEPLDLLRELRTLRPTVVHFSGRDRIASTAALAETFGAAGTSVELVVLGACYPEALAEALLAHVDCVVRMSDPIRESAARSFAIGFYGGLAEREPVTTAYRQGRAAISLEGLDDGDRPQLRVRAGVDVGKLVLAMDPSIAPSAPPTPIDFTAERQRHGRFVGRADVLELLDQWLLGPDRTSWVVVTGGPGMGKSAILSTWLARREAAGAVVPHHFIRRQVADWDHPEVIAGSLVTQIEAAFPHLRDPAAKPERRLLELLGRVSKQLGSTGCLVALVDGLDEVREEPGELPLSRFLPHVVPPGIRFVCATRPTYPHLSWLEARSPIRRLDLDDGRWAASNEAVVRGFWEVVTSEYRPPLPAETRTAAISHADGNVLHAVMVHDALLGLPAQDRQADRIPRGLEALIGEIWDRAVLHEATRVGLGLLCVAQESLPLDVLAELAGWSYEEKERFRRDARQLLLEEPTSGAGAPAYRPRHDWVRELIVERLGAATTRRHHQTMAQRLATWPPPTDGRRPGYAVRHALAHRIAIDDWSGVRELASNLEYLEARAHVADVFVMEQELADAAARCPVPAVARDLADLARALARESHWVRHDPAGTAGLLWNRLRRTGWTAEDIEARTRVPVEPPFLRVRYAASRGSAALERTLDDHTDWVNACAVTPDGRRVVSASADHTLKIWDLETGRVLATLDGHADVVTACAVSPDGRRVVSASADHTLKVWDLETGRILATLDSHADVVTACTVSPDGRRVVSASHDRRLKVWDLAGRVLATLEGHAGAVTACVVTPDGRRVVSASQDRTLGVWELESGRAVATLDGHADLVKACAATLDGRQVVSVSYDDTIKIWDLDAGCVLDTLDEHPWVRACAVTPDGRRMISGSLDGSLKIWDLEAGRVLDTLDGHADVVTACAVTPDGRRAVSASGDHTLKVWDLHASSAPVALDGHAGAVTACAVTPDGRRVISASHDDTFKVWSLAADRVIAAVGERTSSGVLACAMTPDGRRMISGSQDSTLKVWDVDTGRVIAVLEGHSDGVTACAVTPDGRRVISASDDGTLKAWDLDAGHVIATLDGHQDSVLACAVTPDGRCVVSGSQDRTLKLWDLDSGHVITTLHGHSAGVTACAIAPDGRRLVSASDDATLKVWDLDTGDLLATFDGHTRRVRACVVTPDGRRVVSASFDRTLKVWDLASASCLLTHRGDAAFRCVAATTDGIIAGDGLGTVWFLELPSSEVREAPQLASRP